MAQLIIVRGPRNGERIDLTTFPVTIGRDPAKPDFICIQDDEISRQHFLIKKRGRLYILQDLESKNGTYLNGDKIQNSILRNGDKILLGSTELCFLSSEARIQLSSEIHEHRMLVDEELTDYQSTRIPLSGDIKNTGFSPIRIGKFSIIQNDSDNLSTTKKIYDLHANMLVIHDIHEAARTILKSLGNLLPTMDRAAFLMWPGGSSRFLEPYAVSHFKRKKPFHLNKAAIEDVINRKLGVILASSSEKQAELRAIIPVICNNHVLGVIHLESTDPNGFPLPIMDQINSFLSRCAPSLETLYLRQELDSWLVGSMEALIRAVEAKDTYTHGHSERVSRYSMAIANELKLDRHTKKLLLASAMVHDVGKIGIPDNILKKASMLSPDEYEEMKLHPTIGVDIISHLPNSQKFISGVKYHHEKWDGTGYPDGLAGEEIPFFARIVCVSDVFDAMVSGRSYSGFMDQNDAAEKLASEKDLFDPEVLNAFIRAQESGALTLKTSTQNQSNPNKEGSRDFASDFLEIDKKEA